MSANINSNALRNFITRDLGIQKLNENEALKYDIKADKYQEANTDENDYLDIDEILEDSDLYEQFATLYVAEQEKDTSVDSDKEKEKEAKVKDKGGSKA